MTGRWSVPAGSLVLAATAFAFLVVSARALGPEDYAPLAALWALVFATAPALFAPLEQELTRAMSTPEPASAGPPALRTATRAALVLLAAMGGLLLLASPLLHRHVLDGNLMLTLGLALAVIGHCLMHLTRGLLLGEGAQGWYGGSLAADGLLRLVPVLALSAAAVRNPGPYGLVLGGSTLVAAMIVLPRAARAGRRRIEVDARQTLRTVALLVPASVISLALINAAPVVVKVLADPSEAGDAGRVLAGLILVRIPFFAVPTLQARLLPRFARLHASGDRDVFGGLLRQVITLHVAATGLACLAVGTLGDDLLGRVFGNGFRLGAVDLVLLALGSSGHLLAVVLGNALVGQQRAGRLAWAWSAALLAAVLSLVIVEPLLLRVELALLVGGWTAGLVVLLSLAASARPSVRA